MSHDAAEQFRIRQLVTPTTSIDAQIPRSLKARDQWLLTTDKPGTAEHKQPHHPRRGWNNGNTLGFEEAMQAYRDANDVGLGFVFTDSDPFVGLDLDGVIEDGSLSDEASHIVEDLESYTEVSTSGTGLHIITRGTRLERVKSRADLLEGHIEVYDTNRYFVLTGDIHQGYSSLTNRPEALQTLQETYLPERGTESIEETPVDWREEHDLPVTPDQVRRTIVAYTTHPRYSVDEEVIDLWDGRDLTHSSPSEADLAFTAQLYFWCQGDRQLMDACFRSSKRMRPKWDAMRGEMTYGERTIDTACSTNTKTFQGTYVN